MNRRPIFLSLGVISVLLIGLFGVLNGAPKTTKYFGDSQPMGQGAARSFVEVDHAGNLLRIGVVFDQALLEGLPDEPNHHSRCYDSNGNGTFDHHECLGDYEIILRMPEETSSRADIPFKWVGLNWNPHGHVHPAPPQWALPHFDFHFYVQDHDDVQAIRAGSCGELIDCEDFERATLPVPPQYMPANHINVDAAVPAMGNHLINTQSPELVDPNVRFTHTWIYGSYDGHISFYEPMITHEFLESKPNVCTALNLPQAWEESGWYPTEYCIRHSASDGNEYTVTLEKLVYREAQ